MPRVVHVSADFPDRMEPFKTPVIARLIELTNDRFDHRVISLNRIAPDPVQFIADVLRGGGRPSPRIAVQSFAAGDAIAYRAPPAGLFHATLLDRLGRILAARIAQAGIPDLIVGHKLTIEGIVVARAAKLLGIPYALSIQGGTDSRVLQYRPDLRPALARIYHEAAVVFPFSVWAYRAMAAQLGPRRAGVVLLPCPTDLDQPVPPRAGGSGLVSLFHLKNHKRKNLAGLVAAQRWLRARCDAPPLSIIGGGTAAQMSACQAVVGSNSGTVLVGPVGRPDLQQRLNQAIGLVLPSRRESFGLAFIEALFSGLPVIYPAGAAIDGFFDDAPFAVRVDAADTKALAAAMHKLVVEEATLKHALAAWQSSAAARRFQRATIGADFAAGLLRAIALSDNDSG